MSEKKDYMKNFLFEMDQYYLFKAFKIKEKQIEHLESAISIINEFMDKEGEIAIGDWTRKNFRTTIKKLEDELESSMTLADKSTEFLNHLKNWLASRPTVELSEVISEPEKSAIISIDVINAFLYEGPLSSPRVASIDKPITELMRESWDLGLRNILLVQDRHSEETEEFDEYGQHAMGGTDQAEAIDMIKNLPFYGELTTIYKDTIHPALNNGFDEWIDKREQVNTFIAVGDVTDLCVYQLATYLKLRANAYHLERRVIVPANCVQTWHLSVEDAKELPAMAHHGDMLHATFLYHMALNGIEVVKEIRV